MITYSRYVAGDHPDGGLIETAEHVKAHLSSVASAGDDPDVFADDVTINYVEQDNGGWLVVGELDEEPTAPYLLDGYDPDAEDTGHTFTPWKGPA